MAPMPNSAHPARTRSRASGFERITASRPVARTGRSEQETAVEVGPEHHDQKEREGWPTTLLRRPEQACRPQHQGGEGDEMRPRQHVRQAQRHGCADQDERRRQSSRRSASWARMAKASAAEALASTATPVQPAMRSASAISTCDSHSLAIQAGREGVGIGVDRRETLAGEDAAADEQVPVAVGVVEELRRPASGPARRGPWTPHDEAQVHHPRRGQRMRPHQVGGGHGQEGGAGLGIAQSCQQRRRFAPPV